LEGVFGFQRLDAYQCAIQFLALTAALAERAPRGYGVLSDQLRRAALSVPLNIAEGSGKSERDAARFYTIARGSALECAAILDALEALSVVNSEELRSSRVLLERVVSMLTKLRSKT
jgi:four helix bundle protein